MSLVFNVGFRLEEIASVHGVLMILKSPETSSKSSSTVVFLGGGLLIHSDPFALINLHLFS